MIGILSRLNRKYKNYKHLLSSLISVVVNGYPAAKLKVIGVTGTDGKTTTSHLIYHILKANGSKVALISTLGAFMGDKKIDTGLHVTTPDAKILQPLIKKMVDSGMEYLVLETTSHGLDQYRTFGCNYYAGVLTNVTHEHLDYHFTFDRYRGAKSKLFKGVKIAILNKDDPSYKYFRSRLGNNTTLVGYSTKGRASVYSKRIRLQKNSMSFIAVMGNSENIIETKLIGEYNVSNILAAIGIAHKLGVDWNVIADAIAAFDGVKGRMQLIPTNKRFSVIVDFAHTPNALRNVLTTLKKLIPKRVKLIAIFGCAGERDRAKRPMMGAVSARFADVSVFTAEDPRTEDVNQIINQMAAGATKAGGKENSTYYRIPDRRKAILFAIKKLASKGDVIVICGKGHEKSMAFGKREIPWDDASVVKNILLN